MGRPIIQLPEDVVRIQELIWRLQPELIIETGVAHGGSLIFYASLFEAMRKGRVIGIDVEIRAHNRAAIEAHPLAARITLIEGNSVAPSIVEALRAQVRRGETVLVVLDSNHSLEHVAAELSAYSPMVSAGSYVVACDGIMKQVAGAPRTAPDWTWNNPLSAVDNFLAGTSEFVREEPPFAFNEGRVRDRVTYWPKCFLKRIAGGEK
jgi:cephalosporin hydroxylase